MALMRIASAAAKQLGLVLGHQNPIRSRAISPLLEKPQVNVVSNRFAFQLRNFRCSPSHLSAAEPHVFVRAAPVNASAPGEAETSSGKKKKGKKGTGQHGKDSSEKPKIKERSVIFECQECLAMCVKRVQEEHLDRGVVIVRCMGCRSPTLVADNLGLFEEEGSMQKFLSERGVDLVHGAENSYELLAEDLVKMAEMDEQRKQQEQEQQQQQQASSIL
ncbi:mitochondrial protein import protein ZIM17 [Marchantia polymorpha subsp. ruderalis]|uniref:DNL-type domain-containing protein n=2 Tax=Marchantia polymorpha TaxID=3197 RepID=A0A176VRV1_MARPO|nr:hypothetical protein AXG93_961s1110 [Marchantia polymorpha subsp. ruderalis]PTQ41821.1 hypothetical protein MARPO_0032s0026 [Marchantia polymorpha]BBN11607.1 hypothetical protein Mp_5g13330 [Marchantia polymorpha subsp. ruderalis]|eukprot:PTQ41821.1 hypothetical protein MARPO_0032s0026 [Marchantia polymorpha]